MPPAFNQGQQTWPEKNDRGDDTMRPKINGDTFYFPTADGVYFRNNRGSFTLKGKGIDRLLDVLTPYLDGRHTLEEIISNVPVERQGLVQKLVEVLIGRGLAQDLIHDLPHHLSQKEQQAYEAEIAFIGAFTDSAPFRFERYRQSRMLLIGSGLTLTALVHAALHSGLRQVNVIVTGECPTGRQKFSDYLALYRGRDGEQTVEELEEPAWHDTEAVRQTLRAFDVIMHMTDRAMLKRARLLNCLCIEQQKVFIQAVVAGDQAWVGPLVQPGQRGCWECAWRRLQSNLAASNSQAIFEDRSISPISRFVAAPTAAIVANLLNFEIFKYISSAGPLETDGHLLFIDLETLQNQRHRFLAHALCEVCSRPVPVLPVDFQKSLQELAAGPEITPEQFSQNGLQLFDEKAGLFSDLDEHDFIQLPLNLTQVTISRPGDGVHHVMPQTAIGADADFGTARRKATQRACEIYAAHLCDARRLLTAKQVRAFQSDDEAPVLFTNHACESDGPDSDEWYTWALELTTGRVCALPASRAFPGLPREHATDASEFLEGVASGMSWAEALHKALLAHCQRLSVERISRAREPFPRIALDELSLPEAGEHYRKLLETMDVESLVYDITATPAAPAFAFCIADDTIAYASSRDQGQAITEGLEQLILHRQALDNQQPVYAPAPVYQLPASTRGTYRVVPKYEVPPTYEEANTRLLETLQNWGYTALAIPLDHDAELSKVFPYIVRVVLVSREQ